MNVKYDVAGIHYYLIVRTYILGEEKIIRTSTPGTTYY